ncbi:MAG: hypothetical protein NTZ33_02275 [Bacteroidetes bacterium]|nr:hypothetical protein [Bacteroidota bacterium]
MKKITILFCNLFIIISIITGSSANAQTKNVIPDSRLFQCFEKSYIDNLVKTNPEQILYLNYYLDNSYYVASLKAEKQVLGIDIHTVFEKTKIGGVTTIPFSLKSYNKSTFNVLKYNFQTGYLEMPNYIWNEAGIVVVFRPEKDIREDFNMLQKAKK